MANNNDILEDDDFEKLLDRKIFVFSCLVLSSK